MRKATGCRFSQGNFEVGDPNQNFEKVSIYQTQRSSFQNFKIESQNLPSKDQSHSWQWS